MLKCIDGVYSEMTEKEIASLHTDTNLEPTIEERLQAAEEALLTIISLGGL